MTLAVEHLLAHEAALAARLVRRELGELLLKDETVTDEAIQRAAIALTDWRAACHAILMAAAAAPDGETWNAWVARLKKCVADQAARLGKTIEPKTLGARFKKAAEGGDAPRGALASTETTAKQTVITVHQAKGREFDAVLLYVPKPHGRNAPCPSDEWWSTSATSEEREVAFVACSRAREILVLAVHKKTYDARKAKRGSFVESFEVHELGDAASSMNTKR